MRNLVRVARRALSSAPDPELAILQQRPIADLLSRCQLTRKTPAIATLAGMETALPLTKDSWPESSHTHADSTALLPEGAVFDLVLVGARLGPSELARLLEGVAPGGTLAMCFHEAPSCWSSSLPAAGVMHDGVFDIRIDLDRSRSEKPPQPTPHWLSWSEVIHQAPPIGGPTKSYGRKSSMRRVACGHMIESGWKTSTFSPRVALQNVSSSIIDERRTCGGGGEPL